MKFEWDSNKNDSNKAKHGIDFETSEKLWIDENRIEIIAHYPLEDRRIVIGTVQVFKGRYGQQYLLCEVMLFVSFQSGVQGKRR